MSIIETKREIYGWGTTVMGDESGFSSGISHPRVTRYYNDHGLQEAIPGFQGRGHLIFACDKGIFRFDQARNALFAQTFGNRFDGQKEKRFCAL